MSGSPCRTSRSRVPALRSDTANVDDFRCPTGTTTSAKNTEAIMTRRNRESPLRRIGREIRDEAARQLRGFPDEFRRQTTLGAALLRS